MSSTRPSPLAFDPPVLYQVSKFHKGIHKEDTKKKWI